MKWSNHEKLSAFGVQIEGWPSHIPHQNPSSLSATQNKEILQGVQDGTISFVRLLAATPNETSSEPSPTTRPMPHQQSSMADDFSWAYKTHGSMNEVSQLRGVMSTKLTLITAE